MGEGERPVLGQQACTHCAGNQADRATVVQDMCDLLRFEQRIDRHKTQPAAAIPSSDTTVSMRLSRKMPIRAPGAMPSEAIAWPSAHARSTSSW